MICKVVELNNEIYLTSDEEIQVNDWIVMAYERYPTEIGKVERLINRYNHNKGVHCYNNRYEYHSTKCFKIIVSTQALDGVLQIPDEFIQICLDNDEVNVLPDKSYNTPLGLIKITPVEKVQEAEIFTHNDWWNSLTIESREELFNKFHNIYD